MNSLARISLLLVRNRHSAITMYFYWYYLSRYRSTLLSSSFSAVYYYNSLLISSSSKALTSRGISGLRSRLTVKAYLVITTKPSKLDFPDKEDIVSINTVYLCNGTNFLLFSIICSS